MIHVLPNIHEDFLLVGDFNAHNPIWDAFCIEADRNGTKIEQIVNHNNLCILNEGDISTYYSKTHGTYSSIDLTISSSNTVDRYEWNVLDDAYTSDHFPILITCLKSSPTSTIQRYNIDKADWDMYKYHTSKVHFRSNI